EIIGDALQLAGIEHAGLRIAVRGENVADAVPVARDEFVDGRLAPGRAFGSTCLAQHRPRHRDAITRAGALVFSDAQMVDDALVESDVRPHEGPPIPLVATQRTISALIGESKRRAVASE